MTLLSSLSESLPVSKSGRQRPSSIPVIAEVGINHIGDLAIA